MKKQQRYTPEFRAEAVKLVTEQGLSQHTAAERLAIPKGTLANWVAASKSSAHPSAPGSRSATELAAENARLRKELAPHPYPDASLPAEARMPASLRQVLGHR